MSECSSVLLFFFFKQKTAYEMRISDWSSDVCSSDLLWKADAMHPTEGVSRRKRRAKALRSSDRGGAAWDKSRRFAAFHAHSGDWNERPPGQETPARQLASREGRPHGVVRGLCDADPV